jgi:TetR/AcrR family transcriptional regulator, cholesterol catabolism regulator
MSPKKGKASDHQPVDRPQILREAAQLFGEHGYHATTMQQIGEKLGLLKGSLYYHIASKEELLIEMLTASVSDVRASVEKANAAGGTPRERLVRAIEAEVKEMAGHLDEIRIWLAERHRMEKTLADVTKQVAQVDELILGILEDGQRSGEWSPGDLSLAFIAIREMVASFATWYRPGGRLGPEQIAASYARFAAAILASE